MDEYKNPYKVFISVTAEYTCDGAILPISFVWEDGKRYKIDKLVDVRHAASLKAGGAGLCYTCMIHGKQTHLYLEDDRWFMERRVL